MDEVLTFAIAHGGEIVKGVFDLIADVHASPGKLTAAEVEAKFAEIHARIIADRATEDAELAARFPPKQ